MTHGYVRRARFSARWQIRAEGIEMFRPRAVAIVRYRYRGTKIPTPWSSAPTLGAPASGMNTWRAGCGESRTSGSEGGPGKPTTPKGWQGALVRPLHVRLELVGVGVRRLRHRRLRAADPGLAQRHLHEQPARKRGRRVTGSDGEGIDRAQRR